MSQSQCETRTFCPLLVNLEPAHSAMPLDGVTLAVLVKEFGHAIPDEEFSVAAPQCIDVIMYKTLQGDE